MVSYTTILQPSQNNIVDPHPTGVNAPAVTVAGPTLMDDFPSWVGLPVAVSFTRFTRIPARFKKSFGGFKNVGVGDSFFDDIYVLPVSVDAGIILSVLIFEVEVYNAYRTQDIQWTGYDDSSAGDGVTLADGTVAVPPPTVVISNLLGSIHNLQIDPDGPPTIAGEAIFDFLDPLAVAVQRTMAITGQRAVVFPFEPETPIEEELGWVTEIRKSSNGEEQRAALREVPRSTIKMKFGTETSDRRRIENIIFEGQGRTYGVPVWYEVTELTADVAIAATTIFVVDTTYMNIVEGGLAIVWADSDNFETLQVSSLTPSSITFSSPLINAFSSGAFVMPVLTTVLTKKVGQTKSIVNYQTNDIDFVVIDNGTDLADTSAFSSYNGRVLLDDPNLVRGDTTEGWSRDIDVVDNQTSFPEIFTDQNKSRQDSNKGFYTDSPLGLSNVRKLLHALKGRWKAFYLPTFFNDMQSTTAINSSQQAITIEDVDYVSLVAGAVPRNVIRVVKNDGTKSLPKLITEFSSSSPGEETILISPDTVGIDSTLSELNRIEYIQKTRCNSDKIKISHFNSNGKSKITFPTVTVLEGDV